MENYEEKYKQALERARESYNKSIEKGWTCDKSIYEEIFPELEESEDEKIRKKLIAFFKAHQNPKIYINYKYFEGLEISDILAWLEKQKPVDKVESKFKVGDWVVNNETSNLCHISKIEHGQYICYDCSFPISKENNYHIWTIQDAKDGDVLAIDWTQDSDASYFEKIVIFKDLNKDGIEGYGSTFKNGQQFFNGESIIYSKTWTTTLHPATKEQRDLLFAKMGEAGYEWDADNKELKKIEQKSFEWGEEDEGIIDEILHCLEACESEWNYDVSKEKEWLNSIKPNHWKPTEEQMDALKLAYHQTDIYNICGIGVLKSLYSDLQKLMQ